MARRVHGRGGWRPRSSGSDGREGGPTGSRREHREPLPTPDGGGRGQPRVVDVDFPLGEPPEDLSERDAALEPGEGSAEAIVDAVAEGELWADAPVDVEPVTVGVVTVVAVGRSDEEHHDAPRGHGPAVQVHAAGNVARRVRGGGLVAADLLDGVGGEGAELDEVARLVMVVGEHLAGPA